MIRSLLVANRGEIACRIFRSARRLGIRTVAVYSDADAGARHVRAADSAVHLGAAPARDSYLNVQRILAAARLSGADAVHPGYGFLSENAGFARACTAAGLTFVGPTAASIAAMGSKILAKTRMQAAGVPVLPGYAGDQQGLAHLERAGAALGFPLIVKPASGGGGKGMQIVRAAAQLRPALAAARRLAEGAFGDGALLIERYLESPRHLEVQVFADAHGHTVHLGERDCSIQRRHQKLIEEAPAPGVPDAVRARLRAAALTVARAVDYRGAGTVEFLYDGGEFYFMEMNTRLQVEHTVTEAVTGLDLVEWQLRVACGEPLPLTQDQVHVHGHAIEARVCAEDPAHGFLPSAGRLVLLDWPQGEGIRVDAGFGGGDTVPDTYDSLLGKVIAWGSDRAQAAARLAAALERTDCAGVRSNERYLAQLVRTPQFLGVRHSIAFIDRGGAPAEAAAVPGEAAILAALALQHAPASADPWAARDGFQPNLSAPVELPLKDGARPLPVRLGYSGGLPVSAQVGEGPAQELAEAAAGEQQASVRIGQVRSHARVLQAGSRVHVWLAGAHY
ncbi:MAG TPA: biotin carboxylase N-terminal domain-containing protein, partial [Steroidobacteraceae bacterium]|nr:biotin carboxylase N-terminal domain-containing protein [Steroidobacteraceae bacterium]